MPHVVPHRPKLVALVVLVLLLVLLLLPSSAFAHDRPKLPANVTGAVVHVDAYEHETLGVAIGDGLLVLVPFDTIEVARPGFPHAVVTDANGVRHDAGLAATDREAGLALLAVEHPVTATPLALSPLTLGDAIDTFGVGRYRGRGPLDDDMWTFYPAGTLAGRGAQHCEAPYPPQAGSPIVDVEGRLVGLMSGGIFLTPQAIAITPAAIARLDGSVRERRRVIFYGGLTLPFSFAPEGGLWFGLGLTFSGRVRDLVDLRLDADFTVLVPTRIRSEACTSRCYAGIRGTFTPSIGYRHVVGGFSGMRAWPIALVPSVGVAFGVQDTSRENGATAYDAATPSTWAQLAPALTLSLPFGEVRGGVRIPLDEPRTPSVQLGLGFVF